MKKKKKGLKNRMKGGKKKVMVGCKEIGYDFFLIKT